MYGPGQRTLRVIGALLLGGAQACGGGSSGGAATASDPGRQAAVLADFGAKVVVPTYQQFEDKATGLVAAVAVFKGARTAENLKALRDAWSATRTPWEQGEAFLIGPVVSYSFDGAVDSWPLNHTDLASVLAGSDPFTVDFVDSRLADTQKGFHAIEYVIFGDTSDKAAAAFTDRELEFLAATAGSLAKVAVALQKSWTDTVGGKEPYQKTLATAGMPGNATYPSRSAGLQDVLEKMAGICNEVAEGKIATPLAASDPNLVESQFSFNSLRDFADNIRSVQNAYLGANPAAGTSGASLSSLVSGADAALDGETKAQIEAAIAAIQAIPEPFPKSLQDKANTPVINAAQEKIRTLERTLKERVEPLVIK